MKGSYFVSLALAVLVWGPSVTRAQRGGRLAGGFSSVSGRPVSALSASPVRTSRRSGFISHNVTVTSGFGATNLYPGTGLGINGINTILTQSNLGVEAAIDPATQWNLALAQRLLKSSGLFASGGYYLLSGGGAYAVPAEAVESDQPLPQQQPQVIVVQQAPEQQTAVRFTQEPVSPSLPDVGQFALILQDGKQIQAIAFTHGSDGIIYIASDGSRRTIALSDLDAEATVRVNQERGTPLQLPL
jgi:hypothetical protein